MGWLREMAEARDHGKSIKHILTANKRTKRVTQQETVYVLFDLDGTLISVDVEDDRLALFPNMPP